MFGGIHNQILKSPEQIYPVAVYSACLRGQFKMVVDAVCIGVRQGFCVHIPEKFTAVQKVSRT